VIALKKLLAVLLIAALLMLSGCAVQPVPTPEPTPELTPTPTEEPFSPVWTDWSKLEPYEAVTPVYTLHDGYCADGPFQARSDYGNLLVYIGKYASMEMYVEPYLPFYGLVTDRGELVTDPVYAEVHFYDGFIVLYKGDPEGTSGGDTFNGGTFDRTVISADGSWVLDLGDEYFVGCSGGLLTTAKADGTLIIWNADCETVARFDGTLFREAFGDGFIWGDMDRGGPYVNWTRDGIGYAEKYDPSSGGRVMLYLDISKCSVSDTPPAGMPEEYDWSWNYEEEPEPPVVEGCSYLDTLKDEVTGTHWYYGYYRKKPGWQGHYALFDSDGKLLLQFGEWMEVFSYPRIRAGLISSDEDGYWCYRTIPDGDLVFRYFMRTNTD
jgi:hypothetical protein